MLQFVMPSRGRLTKIVKKADSFRDLRQFDEAAKWYSKAVRLTTGRPDLYVQLGNMLKDSGQLAEAVKAYECGHNGYRSLAARRGEAWANDGAAEALLQLGHTFKLAGASNDAVSFYRRSHALRPIPHIEDELKIAALTIHGVPERAIEIPYPTLDGVQELTTLDGVQGLTKASDDDYELIKEGVQCLCWSKNHFRDISPEQLDLKVVTCADCGTHYSTDVVRMNMMGETRLVPVCEVTAMDLEGLLATWPVEVRLNRIGLVGAELVGSPPSGATSVETIPAYNSRLLPGLERCSFDAIILWNMSLPFTDLTRIVDQCHQAIRPNGMLMVGYTPTTALTLWAQRLRNSLGSKRKGQAKLPAAVRTAGAGDVVITSDPSPLFFLSDRALRAVLDPVRRDARLLPQRYEHSSAHHFRALQKSGTMSVGIMSGIGDAVWSFVIQEAVRRKYGADALLYHVNDSGDGRRKRSNNMLARFNFVDDMVTSKFQIHADTPMDDRSGHLNYMPSGPVTVDGRDEFDYRLIVNTYLEHGHSYARVCEALGLDEGDLDFDFFRKYREQPEDMRAVNKVLNYVGEDYAIFYYGAEVDNTIGGLNRDEMWKPEDWNRLGRMVHEQFGLKIVVIGAPYDVSYANKILGANEDTFYFNAIGQLDITETLALIQRSRFVIAFPAGVGIVGPYMRVPTVIFWRPKHMSYHVMHDRAGFCPEFATNWVPEPVLERGGYYPAWYGSDTPETIMAAIERGGWATRKITSPIGNWKD
jgi:hypothetical protein